MSNSDSRDLRDQEWFVILSRRKAAECQSRQANMVAAAGTLLHTVTRPE